jgi:hypothetical protein
MGRRIFTKSFKNIKIVCAQVTLTKTGWSAVRIFGLLGVKTRIEIQTLLIEEDKFYFTNLYKLHNLYILMDFHFVFLKGIFLKSA